MLVYALGHLNVLQTLCLIYQIISLYGIPEMHLKHTREELVGVDFVSNVLLRGAQGLNIAVTVKPQLTLYCVSPFSQL